MTSTFSTNTDRIVYDYFDIHIYDECVNSNPTVVTGVDDATYLVDATAGSGTVTYTPDFDPDTPNCPYTATIMAKLDGTSDNNYAAVGTNTGLDLSFMS